MQGEDHSNWHELTGDELKNSHNGSAQRPAFSEKRYGARKRAGGRETDNDVVL